MRVKIVKIPELLILFENLVDSFLAKQSDKIDTSLFGYLQGEISVPQHKAIVSGFSGQLSKIPICWISDIQLPRIRRPNFSFCIDEAIIEMAASYEIFDKSFFLFTIENHLCYRIRSSTVNDCQQLDIRYFRNIWNENLYRVFSHSVTNCFCQCCNHGR